MIDVTEYIEGPNGCVEYVSMAAADDPRYADRAHAALAVWRGTWLITAPPYHLLWSQYLMSVISLADAPGVPPAVRKFDGSTHELLVVAINPESGPQTVETIQTHSLSGDLPYLTPVNVAEQFECTDDEITTIRGLGSQLPVGAIA